MRISLDHICIRGIANCVPKNIVYNKDYDRINDQEKKLLIKTTGISERRVVNNDICASDLCFAAAKKLIDELKWSSDSIDALIFVSQSSDYYLPATAIILQDKLGLPTSAIAFDVNLGCSGYVYGLQIMSSMMQSGVIKRALLLAGDISTNSVNYNDKSSYPIFGDSGSATAMEFDPSAEKSFFSSQSDGAGFESIIIKGGGTRHKFHDNSLKEVEIEPGISRHELNLILNGLEIFNFSVKRVPEDVKSLLSFAEMTDEAIDYYIFHQANKIINETIRKKLKIDPEKVPYSLELFGNTSSGSIPLTIQTKLQKQLTTQPSTLLLSGFGVGLSWGSAIIKLNDICLPDLIEI